MEWFVHAWARTLVQEHVKEVNKKLGKSEFRAWTGWWGSFRNRRQIVFSEVCGEAGSVCEETVADWFARLQVPVWTGTCVQWKNSGPLQFHYRLVSLYQYFIVIAWSIRQWTLNIPVLTHTVAARNPRRHRKQISKYDGNGWWWTFYETLHRWCTYLTRGTS